MTVSEAENYGCPSREPFGGPILGNLSQQKRQKTNTPQPTLQKGRPPTEKKKKKQKKKKKKKKKKIRKKKKTPNPTKVGTSSGARVPNGPQRKRKS